MELNDHRLKAGGRLVTPLSMGSATLRQYGRRPSTCWTKNSSFGPKDNPFGRKYGKPLPSRPGLHSSRLARSHRFSREPVPLAGTTSRSDAANHKSRFVAFGLPGTVAFWEALPWRQLSATTGRCLRCGASVEKSANGRYGRMPGSRSAYRAVSDCGNASTWADSVAGAISISRNIKHPQRREFDYSYSALTGGGTTWLRASRRFNECQNGQALRSLR